MDNSRIMLLVVIGGLIVALIAVIISKNKKPPVMNSTVNDAWKERQEQNSVSKSVVVSETGEVGEESGQAEKVVEKGQEELQLDAQIKSGSGWFYWIAALSLVNSISYLSGANFVFVVGLGLTQIVDALIKNVRDGSNSLALVLILFSINAVIAFAFMVLGFLSRKRKTWAFIIGIILYVFDSVIMLVFKEMMGLGFHVFALFFIIKGFMALWKLNKSKQEMVVEESES